MQITRDDGTTWTNVGDRVPGIPPATWAPHVEPSKHDPATAYVVYDDHRRGNWTPYAFRTEDYGQSWEPLGLGNGGVGSDGTPPGPDRAGGIGVREQAGDGVWGFVHVVEEDPVEPSLLFLGTEFGLFASLDRGASWIAWRNGLPPAPVRGLVVHPRDHDLVVGTHGRAAYIIDDIRPLRALAADPAAVRDALQVFPSAPAIQYVEAEAQGYRSTGHAMFMGDRRPYGALLHYWMADPTGGNRDTASDDSAAGDADAASMPTASAQLSILDAAGEVVRTLSGSANRGLNRVVWDLRMALPDDPDEDGPWVLPGRYAVRVEAGEHVAEGSVEVVADPRLDISNADRRARIAVQLEAASRGSAADQAADQLGEMIEAVEEVLAWMPAGEEWSALQEQGGELIDELTALNERLFTGPECQGGCGRTALANRVWAPTRKLNSALGAPTPTDRLAISHAEAALEELLAAVASVMDGPVEAFRQALVAAGYTLLPRAEGLL